MKKRTAALVLSILLVAACLPARAAETVYFTSAGNYLLPLSDNTMPFWSGGYLYIASSIFSGAGREALNVSQILNSAQNRLVLYSGGRSLTFDFASNFAVDNDDNYYYPGAIRRNGTVFVPAYVVTRYFDLIYSVIEVERGSLVWVRQPNYNLSDRLYADAAKYSMDSVYAAYLRAKEQTLYPEEPPSVLPNSPAVPEPSVPSTVPAAPTAPEDSEDPEKPALSGRRIHLCIQADASAAALLDVLVASGVQASFFASQDFLAQEGGLLRRMAATGQNVGLLADGAEPDAGILEQLESGNQALYLATCGRTRLTYIQNASPQQLRDAAAEGYRNLDADLFQDGLQTASSAVNLLRRATAQPGDVTLWLSGLTASGLRGLLTAVEEAGGQCAGWTETT